ncbi:MAG: glycosyltransferase N-terminal domain-containing protein [Elusimicrobiota bacterium]|nr:glycosyltransferase N-terminal domain-containing protein [Elusimicrobiota bacterium]
MSLLVLLLETLLSPLAGLAMVLSFLFSPNRGRLAGLLDELPERFGGIRDTALDRLHGREVWWFHAASAGEVSGLVPLLEALQAKASVAVFLTTTTRSGRDAARALPCVAWAQLAPVDAWPFVARFLKALSPRRLILAETELWPTTLILAGRAGLAPAVVNGRLTGRSFSRYRRLRALLAPALGALRVVAAQSEDDAARFAALGVPSERVKVTGNSKYDRLAAPSASAAARARVAALGWEEDPLFVAGSTHPFEEEMVLAAFMAARRETPRLRLVLAPRHLERAADAADLLAHAGLKLSRWSGPAERGREALILDEMGVLASFYPLARAAFVGGTLVKVGGHNLLEPALAGVPVLFGPHTGHIEAPAALLAAPGGGGGRVRDAAELAERLGAFAKDAAAARAAGAQARRSADGLRGATARTLEALGA